MNSLADEGWRPIGQSLPAEELKWSSYYRVFGIPSFRAQLFWYYVYTLSRDVSFRRWLDVGCGGGDLLIELARRFPSANFVGLDPDPQSIARAKTVAVKAAARNISWHVGFAEEFDDGPFDVVSALGVLEFSVDPAAEIARWASFAKEDGHLIFTAPQLTPGAEVADGRFTVDQVRGWMIRAGIDTPLIFEAARGLSAMAYRWSQRLQHKAFFAASFHVLSLPLVLMDSRLGGFGKLLFCKGKTSG